MTEGDAMSLDAAPQGAPQVERLRRIVEAPVLTQVKARFEGLDTYEVTPQHLPDVMAGRPVLRPAS